MTIDQLPKPKSAPGASPELRALHQGARRYLVELIERSYIFISLRSLEQLKPRDVRLLSGGLNAVSYLVRKPGDLVVVKLDYRTIAAEAEALAAWHRRGASVVAVKSTGIIESTRRHRRPVKYIILEGIIEPGGQPAPLASDFLRRFPARSQALGRAVGTNLALMHRATSKRAFGEFADMTGFNTSPFKTWNAFLLSYVRFNRAGLVKLGYKPGRLKQLEQLIKMTRFPRTGRYLHGDLSLRNILVQTARPMRVSLIDPNPLIGLPEWDLAQAANQTEIAVIKASWRPQLKTFQTAAASRRDFQKGLMAGYDSPVNKRRLELAQLVKAIILTMVHHDEDPNGLDFLASQEQLNRLLDKLCPD